MKTAEVTGVLCESLKCVGFSVFNVWVDRFGVPTRHVRLDVSLTRF